MMIPEKIISGINSASHVVLATHINPDGDALGSLLGMSDMLRGLGKEVFAYLEAPVPRMYDFLPGSDFPGCDTKSLLSFVNKAGKENVVTIVLDSGDAERLGYARDELLGHSRVLVIDHHCGHRPFGDTLWLESDCSSTGEMVYELAVQLGVRLSYEAAFCLYVAIITDTGSFRYECTSPRTLRVAAELLEIGVRPEEAACRIYDNYTMARLRLMELVLATLEVHGGGRIGIISVTLEMIAKSGAIIEDTEGFINYPRSLESVQVAAFIKEMSENEVSVSLRAKGDIDVADVAASFGGGGHKNAAGCRFNGLEFGEVRDIVVETLNRSLPVS